jgi:hypothetical protein
MPLVVLFPCTRESSRTNAALRRCNMTAQLGPFVKAKKSTSDPGKSPAARPGSQPISEEQRATSLDRTPADTDRLVVRGDGTEIELGSYAQLKETFGTDDRFVKGMLSQLANTGAGGKLDHDELNFILSMVKGTKPRDQLEAMLAAQMAATHMATMTLARRLAKVENILQQDSAERAFNKLARTFAAQMEALKRYRTGGEQKVTVQHVSVNEGGQAIVGNVTRAPSETPPEKTADSHRALDDRQTSMAIIEEPEREPVLIRRNGKQSKNDGRSSA